MISLRSNRAASDSTSAECEAAPEEEAVPASHASGFMLGRGGDELGETGGGPRLSVEMGRTDEALAIGLGPVLDSPSTDVRARVDGSDAADGANGAWPSAGQRASLADAVRRIERARQSGRRCDPEEVHKVWSALLGGRWSIVVTCADDERRMILARGGPAGSRPPRALSPRVREVIGYAALGHSNKLIAYAMGISAAAVAKHLRRAQRMMGVSTRRELIALFEGGAASGGQRIPAQLPAELPRPHQLRVYRLDEADGEFVIFDWPIRQRPLPHSLTAAEREVVGRALAGESNLEIARARGTSTRTVANQMATAYRKLGLGSRLELFALLGRG